MPGTPLSAAPPGVEPGKERPEARQPGASRSGHGLWPRKRDVVKDSPIRFYKFSRPAEWPSFLILALLPRTERVSTPRENGADPQNGSRTRNNGVPMGKPFPNPGARVPNSVWDQNLPEFLPTVQSGPNLVARGRNDRPRICPTPPDQRAAKHRDQ